MRTWRRISHCWCSQGAFDQRCKKVIVVWSHSRFRFFVTPWTAACHVSMSLTISQSLPKFVSIGLVIPSSHLILWWHLLLPSIFPSIRDFSNGLTSHQVTEPRSFSFSISEVFHFTVEFIPLHFSEYSGLIPLKNDCDTNKNNNSALIIGDCPGTLVAKTACSQCREARFDPWSGNCIPYASAKNPACHNLDLMQPNK